MWKTNPAGMGVTKTSLCRFLRARHKAMMFSTVCDALLGSSPYLDKRSDHTHARMGRLRNQRNVSHRPTQLAVRTCCPLRPE
jgi:hypothetical protein